MWFDRVLSGLDGEPPIRFAEAVRNRYRMAGILTLFEWGDAFSINRFV